MSGVYGDQSFFSNEELGQPKIEAVSTHLVYQVFLARGMRPWEEIVADLERLPGLLEYIPPNAAFPAFNVEVDSDDWPDLGLLKQQLWSIFYGEGTENYVKG